MTGIPVRWLTVFLGFRGGGGKACGTAAGQSWHTITSAVPPPMIAASCSVTVPVPGDQDTTGRDSAARVRAVRHVRVISHGRAGRPANGME